MADPLAFSRRAAVADMSQLMIFSELWRARLRRAS